MKTAADSAFRSTAVLSDVHGKLAARYAGNTDAELQRLNPE
jgi:hypothetical protein